MDQTICQQNLESRREILRARGIPEAFIEELATRKEAFLNSNPWVLTLVFTLLIFVLVFWAHLYILPWLSAHEYEQVRVNGWANGSLLFHFSSFQSFAVLPFLLMVLGGLSLVYSVIFQRVKSHPAANDIASGLRQLTPLEKKGGYLVSVPAKARKAKSEREFLSHYTTGSQIVMAGITVLFAMFTGLIYIAGESSYWGVFPDRAEIRQFGVLKSYPLDNAQYVVVGCNHQSESERLIYDVHFKDRSIAFDDAVADMPPSQFISHLEIIDANLRAHKVSFQRWQWPFRDPMAPDCLSHWEDLAGNNGQSRLKTLLSVP